MKRGVSAVECKSGPSSDANGATRTGDGYSLEAGDH